MNQLIWKGILITDVPVATLEVTLLCGWLHVHLRSSIVQCVFAELPLLDQLQEQNSTP